MIIDQINNASHYFPLVAGLDKALAWLNAQQLASIAPGTYAIDGSSIYAIITTVEPKNLQDTHFEVHRKFVDCHVILSGVETVAYAPMNTLKPENEYDPAVDCQLFTGSGRLLTVDPGQFWIALPSDAHWPAIQSAQNLPVRKAIIKLATG